MNGVVEAIQQLNNTLFEIYTGKPNAIYPKLGENEKPASFEDRKEYLVPVQERIKKTTEVLSGILVGIYNEDEIKTKLEKLNINDLQSVEENLQKLSENASFLKTYINRTSNFSGDSEHSAINPFVEIERAIKGLVLTFIYSNMRSEIKIAEMKKDKYPENISQDFLYNLTKAYEKLSGDFAKAINENDPNKSDDHDYINVDINP